MILRIKGLSVYCVMVLTFEPVDQSVGEWNQHGGVLLMGYELYRLLSTVVPSMSSSKSMPTKKKKSLTPTEKINGEPEVIDLDEEEKHMELLIG